MSEFKAGQLVRRINLDMGRTKVGREYIVDGRIGKNGIRLKGLGMFGYDSKNFELVVAAPAFEEGQLVRRIRNDCYDAKVGCVYTVKSGYATNGVLLEGHCNFGYDVGNFELVVEEVLELEQGKLYEFSDDLEFSLGKVTTAKFIADLTEYYDDGLDYTRPLMVWSARQGVLSYKYAREVPVVSCKVFGYNLMISKVEADAYELLKVIQKDNYEAHTTSSRDFNELQQDLVAKYACGGEPF